MSTTASEKRYDSRPCKWFSNCFMAEKNEAEERKISPLQNDVEEKWQARVISELMSLYEANCILDGLIKETHLGSG